MQLSATSKDANGLRQRINRATLSSRWVDEAPRKKLYELAKHNVVGAAAWIIDDTGIIKKGTKSPGVQRQYCGKAGKRDNCQLIVSTHVSGWTTSQPLEADLYLPQGWCDDLPRRREAQIPDEIDFQTKPEIALAQIDRLLEARLPPMPVLADAAYGNGHKFRDGLRERHLEYSVSIKPDTLIWRPHQGPDPLPEPVPGRSGRRRTLRFPGQFQPVQVKDFAAEILKGKRDRITLSRGRHETKEVVVTLTRIRTAHKADKGNPPGPEEWLIIVWNEEKNEPTDFFLSNLHRRVRPKRLVELTLLRWRIERDYQDMKQEVGLEHYEGRSWVGLHHHLTICMAAHAFLASQRKLFPPEAGGIHRLGSQPHCA